MKRHLLICLLLLLAIDYTSGCPAACSCSMDSKGTRANCLSRGLGYFPANFPSDTYDIDLQFNGIQTLNVRICTLYPNLEFLYLGYNQITYIPADVFTDCGHLLILYLNNNKFASVNASTFRNLNNLKYLYLDNNDITDLHVDKFVNLNSLRYLYLYNNKLSTLSASTFRSINNMRYIYIDYNDITDIHVDAFVNLHNLRYMYLNNNKLSSVGVLTFRNLSNLERLQLHYNNIKEIKGGLWENKNLNNLYLNGNPLLCDCGIRSFYDWAKVTASSGARCVSGESVINIHQDYFRLCSYCDCLNGGVCVITETNSTSCQCVGNWTGEKCQENRCASHNCGNKTCHLEGQSGQAVCQSSICLAVELRWSAI